jgi:chaperonin GroES
MKIKPLRDNVLVKRLQSESKSPGGIIIPDTAKEKPIEGEVLAIGEGGRDKDGALIKMTVKVGDRVVFGKWAGTEMDPDHVVMKEQDILGIVVTA